MMVAQAVAGAESQALDIRPVSHRVSVSDIVVLATALVLVVAGWGLKAYHDNRTTTVAIDGVTVAYPTGWLLLPSREPEVLRRVSPEDGRERLTVTAQPTDQTDVLGLIASGAAIPASAEVAFTPLSNQPSTVAGVPSVRSDYAYVQTTVGRATAPTVIRGRQEAWIADRQLYVLAIEAPEGRWQGIADRFDRLAAQVRVDGAVASEPS